MHRWRLDIVDPPVKVVAEVLDDALDGKEPAGTEVTADTTLDPFADRLVLGEEIGLRVRLGRAREREDLAVYKSPFPDDW